MADAVIIDSLKDAARLFIQEHINNPDVCGITAGEKLWLEELSKIYLCSELHIQIPDHATVEFQQSIQNLIEFGADSAIASRLILYTANIMNEKDFLTNTSSYIGSIEHHQAHWSQKHVEAQHAEFTKRPIESFMNDYFEHPNSISDAELTYHLTLYFKHFYRFLHKFMLFYIKQHLPLHYGTSTNTRS